jgi:uncharacterized protein YneF (UPF0154 family)
MNKSGKTLVTILLIIGFFIGGIFLTAAGTSKTFLGLLALGVFYGIRTMWKKPKEEPKSNEIKLEKDDDNNELSK